MKKNGLIFSVKNVTGIGHFKLGDFLGGKKINQVFSAKPPNVNDNKN